MPLQTSDLQRLSRLPEVLGSPALSRLAIHFTLRPFEWVHFRELKRRTGLANRSLQLQLKRLLSLEMILERREGRTVQYRADAAHQGWDMFRTAIREFGSPMEVFAIALAGFRGVEEASLVPTKGNMSPTATLAVKGTPEPINDFTSTLQIAGSLARVRLKPHFIDDASQISMEENAIRIGAIGAEE